MAYIGVSVWTWVASAVFHARDTPLTERLDYMAAFATVVTGFAVSVIRCFGMSRYCSTQPHELVTDLLLTRTASDSSSGYVLGVIAY